MGSVHILSFFPTTGDVQYQALLGQTACVLGTYWDDGWDGISVSLVTRPFLRYVTPSVVLNIWEGGIIRSDILEASFMNHFAEDHVHLLERMHR